LESQSASREPLAIDAETPPGESENRHRELNVAITIPVAASTKIRWESEFSDLQSLRKPPIVLSIFFKSKL
jgi:hypothetical protein